MGLSNCPECGKLYIENLAKLCMECYEKEEKDADKVVEFLREHPKSHINDVHEATGVKHKVILRMLKKGRVIGDISVEYPCESCGKSIIEGRLCNSCSQNILSQITPGDLKKPEPEKKEEPKRSTGMFTTRF